MSLVILLTSCNKEDDLIQSPEKNLLKFELNESEVSQIVGVIDENIRTVKLRVPNTLNLSKVIPSIEISNHATTTSDLSNGIDLSEDYNLSIRAEDGSTKNYLIQTEVMNTVENITFETGIASKWFGGDNRPNFGPRNLGTGQSLILSQKTHLQSFHFHFTGDFDLAENPENIGHEVVINFEIRSKDGISLVKKSITNPSSFNGGWIKFDFSSESILLEAETEYVFIWYLPNGFNNGYFTGSSGDAEKGFSNGNGYDVRITSENDRIDDWNHWYIHSWDFWFKFEGLK